tara:strand:- start:3284 stop:3832 length:549 start_codon:yes stop_codon:yes gene_type:complete
MSINQINFHTKKDNKDSKETKDNEKKMDNSPPNLEIFPINPNIFHGDTIITKGLAGIVLTGVIYLLYRMAIAFYSLELNNLSTQNFLFFLDQKNILSIMIGLMIAANARDVIKSLTNYFILPLLEPIMPFIELQYKVQIGPFKFEIGKLVSDIIMFLINIYIIYIIVSVFSQNLEISSAVAL